jgi:hypothetical protein
MENQLSVDQTQALRLARAIRLNIRMNWGKPACHPIACRLWAEAIRLNLRGETMGFLSVLSAKDGAI